MKSEIYSPVTSTSQPELVSVYNNCFLIRCFIENMYVMIVYGIVFQVDLRLKIHKSLLWQKRPYFISLLVTSPSLSGVHTGLALLSPSGLCQNGHNWCNFTYHPPIIHISNGHQMILLIPSTPLSPDSTAQPFFFFCNIEIRV